MNEIWKPVAGYEGLYEVSNFGNVKSLNYRNWKTVKILTPKINNEGYLWVELRKNGDPRCFLVHRLVASAFICNPMNYPIINHKDENPQNNIVTNLEWCDYTYNALYSINRRKTGASVSKSKGRRKAFKKGSGKTGRINQRNNVPVFRVDDRGVKSQMFENIYVVSKKFGYRSSSIKECCLGKRKTAYGYRWCFAKDAI